MKIGCNNAIQYSAEVYSEPCQKSTIESFAGTLGYNFISNIYFSTLPVPLLLWSQAFLKRFKSNNDIIIKDLKKGSENDHLNCESICQKLDNNYGGHIMSMSQKYNTFFTKSE